MSNVTLTVLTNLVVFVAITFVLVNFVHDFMSDKRQYRSLSDCSKAELLWIMYTVSTGASIPLWVIYLIWS